MPEAKPAVTVQLDAAFIAAVSPAVNTTWNYIASDLIQCVEECGESMTNEGALEAVMDANRIAQAPARAPEVDKMISTAIKEHGYKKVMAFMKKNFKLY